MEKPAETGAPIHDLIRRRWSPVAFADRQVEPQKLRSLFEAARWAPSSSNEQPWSFLLATREDLGEFERMLNCLVEGNIAWARAAPVLAISVAKLQFDYHAKPNRHAYHDVGLAVENLVIQAGAMDLWVHQMAGILVDKIRETYVIPPTHDPVAAMAIGYQGSPEGLSEKLKQRSFAPRTRKPLDSFVFTGQWGQASPIAA